MNKLCIWRQLSKSPRDFIPNKMSLLKVEGKGIRPFRISVEGNIGSGKSTFLNYFKQFPFIETYDEPLENWRNIQGHNLLELLYEDMNKWGATFQSYVQLTRTQVQTSTPREGTTVQIFERSVQNNRYCFMENALKNGSILPAQYSVLSKWYEWLEENVDISLDSIVYLKTSPEVVYKRVLDRNRSEEKTVSLEYLESLHKAHEKWLGEQNPHSPPVFVVDANKCFDEVIESCQKKLPVLFSQNISSLEKVTEQIKKKRIKNNHLYLKVKQIRKTNFWVNIFHWCKRLKGHCRELPIVQSFYSSTNSYVNKIPVAVLVKIKF